MALCFAIFAGAFNLLLGCTGLVVGLIAIRRQGICFAVVAARLRRRTASLAAAAPQVLTA